MYLSNPTGYFNIPEPSLYPPEPVIIGYCAKCRGELYQGEQAVSEDGERMCMNCFENHVQELLQTSPALVAECLGMRYEEVV